MFLHDQHPHLRSFVLSFFLLLFLKDGWMDE